MACNNTNNTFACTSCDTDYVLTNNTCQASCNVENCSSCTQPNICSACDSSFVLASNNTCLLNCSVENCVVCPGGSGCEECSSNYVLLNSVCVLRCNITNCLACSTTQLNVCQSCAGANILNLGFVNITISPAYSPSTDGSSCVTCNTVSNCSSCSAN